MKAEIKGLKGDELNGHRQVSYKQCESIKLVLEAVKKAILTKTDKIVIEMEYDKANEIELKKGLMIKDFE